jgi:hypothetical protein
MNIRPPWAAKEAPGMGHKDFNSGKHAHFGSKNEEARGD